MRPWPNWVILGVALRNPMEIKYAHTNIISKNWEVLADFYTVVFDCKPALPPTHLSGEWLEKGTAVKGADLKGRHLLLPGYGKEGPTLEIFEYTEMLEKPEPAANRYGFGHIAFRVDDVDAVLGKVLEHGGRKLGEVVSQEYKTGFLVFTYAEDPEGNIVEIQNWKPKS